MRFKSEKIAIDRRVDIFLKILSGNNNPPAEAKTNAEEFALTCLKDCLLDEIGIYRHSKKNKPESLVKANILANPLEKDDLKSFIKALDNYQSQQPTQTKNSLSAHIARGFVNAANYFNSQYYDSDTNIRFMAIDKKNVNVKTILNNFSSGTDALLKRKEARISQFKNMKEVLGSEKKHNDSADPSQTASDKNDSRHNPKL